MKEYKFGRCLPFPIQIRSKTPSSLSRPYFLVPTFVVFSICATSDTPRAQCKPPTSQSLESGASQTLGLIDRFHFAMTTTKRSSDMRDQGKQRSALTTNSWEDYCTVLKSKSCSCVYYLVKKGYRSVLKLKGLTLGRKREQNNCWIKHLSFLRIVVVDCGLVSSKRFLEHNFMTIHCSTLAHNQYGWTWWYRRC